MKVIMSVLLLMGLSQLSFGQENGFCQTKAESWMKVMHHKVLDDMGVIQGYNESISYKLKTVRHDMDNLDEDYVFFVDAENDEGDQWTWKYSVKMSVWLNAGGTARYCDVLEANYLGAL